MATKKSTRKTSANDEIQRRIAWEKNVASTVNKWAEASGKYKDGLPSAKELEIIRRRAGNLSNWLRLWLPGHEHPVISVDDGALLVILPQAAAVKLGRRIFRHVRTPGGQPIPILNDLQADDFAVGRFNLDWFVPKPDVEGFDGAPIGRLN